MGPKGLFFSLTWAVFEGVISDHRPGSSYFSSQPVFYTFQGKRCRSFSSRFTYQTFNKVPPEQSCCSVPIFFFHCPLGQKLLSLVCRPAGNVFILTSLFPPSGSPDSTWLMQEPLLRCAAMTPEQLRGITRLTTGHESSSLIGKHTHS